MGKAKIITIVGIVIIIIGISSKYWLKLLLFEDREVVQGELNKLKIGTTKEDALAAAKLLGAKYARPIPREKFDLTWKNALFLQSYNNKIIEGINLFNYSGLSVEVYFVSERVSKIHSTRPQITADWFALSETKFRTLEKAAVILSKEHDMHIMPSVDFDQSKILNLKDKSDNYIAILNNYNAFAFEITSDKPCGSYYEVFFDTDRLVKIKYRRPRVDME